MNNIKEFLTGNIHFQRFGNELEILPDYLSTTNTNKNLKSKPNYVN